MKKVLITGILGQDGSNMAEFLLLRRDDVEVYGMMRRSSNPNFKNIDSIQKHPRFRLNFLELSDTHSIDKAIKDIQPDYFINFGANSFVGVSWDMPEQVFDVNALGVLRCLEAIRKLKPDCRFYSAGSSEEFGNVDYSPQDITHPIKPRSPYGAAKAAARHLVKVYRESYNLYAVHGILFNHEGPKRGEEFLTRKVTKGVARISIAIEDGKPFEPIELGNVNSKRDWSDSEDFVDGIWLMLNQSEPKDYVLSSGETRSVREFVEKSFAVAGIEGYWQGIGVDEGFYLGMSIHEEMPHSDGLLVKVSPKFYRKAEVSILHGDSSPARQELGWSPKISFDQLVKRMTIHDIEEEKLKEKTKADIYS